MSARHQASHPHLAPVPPISPSLRQLLLSPPEVVEEEGDVEAQGHPLCCTQKHQTEEAVDGIFWNHQLGSEGKRSVAWFQDRPKASRGQRGAVIWKLPTHHDLWGLKGSLASHTVPGSRAYETGSRGGRSQKTMGLSWARRLLPPALTLTFLRRQQMRSMFFKRSRCRGRKKARWGWRR